MVNYNNGKIYKIIVNIDGVDDVYIGSTCKEHLCQRMVSHRQSYKKWKNGNKNMYTSSFELFEKHGIENCKIELIELYYCNSKDELNKREGYHIKNNMCINKYVAGRSKKEYYEDNLDKIKEQSKIWRTNNKEYISEKTQQYYEKNKDIILDKMALYYEKNKDKKLQYQKEYTKKNRDTINEKAKEHFNCECGGKYTRVHTKRHINTIKHKKYIEEQKKLV